LLQPIDLSELPLDWELARKRLERDVRDDFFPDPLRNRDLLATAKANYRDVFSLTDYEPEDAESWDVPKPNLTIRHCINISSVDRLVYQALVDHLANSCDSSFHDRSYGFRLRGTDTAEMYRNAVQQFNAFDAATRERLTANPASVLVTIDVAQYFENVPLEGLKQQLISLSGAKLGHPTRAVIDVLVQCLACWTPYKICGLPQNMFPSSFLGNAYLHSLDGEMLGEGWDYHRYMDDIRIIVADEASARRALRSVITKLRARELSVNGKKTGLVRPRTPEWGLFAAVANMELEEIENLVRREDKNELPSVVTRLNALLQQSVDAEVADRRLRFALGRLTSIRQLRRVHVPEPEGYGAKLLALLKMLPDQTPLICEYFHSSDCTAEVLELLGVLLTAEPVCIYPWQNYHLWLLAAEKRLDGPATLARARQLVQDATEAAETAGAAIYLGSVGTLDDRQLLRECLRRNPTSITLRRSLLIALQEFMDEGVADAVKQMAERSPTLWVLARYLERLTAPRYVARSRRVPMRNLADQMPDMFS
jgi:hypothetical protein